MSINVGRRAVVDDSDPRIQWAGDWFQWNDVGDIAEYGPPFLNTLHGFQSSGANLSFSYYGRDFSIIGAAAPVAISSASWVCVQDGQQDDNGALPPSLVYVDVSYVTLCDGQHLAEGNHTVQVIFTRGNLWVDSIQYLIASTADIGDEWEVVEALDTRIQYPSGPWYETRDKYRGVLHEIRPGKWTNSYRGSLIYDFIGEAVTWNGFMTNNSALGTGLGHYILDGKQPPTPFSIRAPGNQTWENQVLFNISGLKPGPHRLEVLNDGNSTTVPLGLRTLFTKSSQHGGDGGKKRKIIGGAVGGGLGVLLIILVLISIFVRRQRRRRQCYSEEVGVTKDGRINTSGKMAEKSQTPALLAESQALLEESQAPGTHPVPLSQPPLSSFPGPRAINSGEASTNAEQIPVQRIQDGKVEEFEHNPWD